MPMTVTSLRRLSPPNSLTPTPAICTLEKHVPGTAIPSCGESPLPRTSKLVLVIGSARGAYADESLESHTSHVPTYYTKVASGDLIAREAYNSEMDVSTNHRLYIRNVCTDDRDLLAREALTAADLHSGLNHLHARGTGPKPQTKASPTKLLLLATSFNHNAPLSLQTRNMPHLCSLPLSKSTLRPSLTSTNSMFCTNHHLHGPLGLGPQKRNPFLC